MNGLLDGKVALITGAGGTTIGRATSRRFGADGAVLVCADREKDAAAGKELVAELADSGVRATAVTVDLHNDESVRRMITDAIAEHGRLDVLFNLMVWGRAHGSGNWEWTMNGTFAPTYFGTRYGAEYMSRHGGGTIINISSIAGVALTPAIQPLPPLSSGERATAPVLGAGSYAAAKATVGMLTREYAVLYGRRGVRVNAIAPGLMATSFTLNAYGGDTGRAEEAIPLGRLGRAEDVAAAARFLASDDAAYITGHVLMVDGGFSQRPAH